MKQYIYCYESPSISKPSSSTEMDGFHYCSQARALAPIKTSLESHFGTKATKKIYLKLLSGRRRFYAVVLDGKLVHYGWLSVGFCKYYPVEKNSIVIGPVATLAQARGKGVATGAIRQVLPLLQREGVGRIYIDTSEDNTAMLRVIRRCGFSILMGTYDRNDGKDTCGQWRSRIKKIIPKCLLQLIRLLIGEDKINHARWKREAEQILKNAKAIPVSQSFPRVGIVKDIMLRHSYYEAACQELGVPYDLVDIKSADWVDAIRETECEAYVVRPFVLNSSGKRLYDDRIRIMREELGKKIYPSEKSLWLYESKKRTAGWLQAHDVAHPETWCFHTMDRALKFAATCPLPIVFKTDLGSEAAGVKLIRTRRDLLLLVRRCFTRGVGALGYDSGKNVIGEVLLQAYVPNAREWRMVRIGNSYFGHRKGKRGDFHSGSKIIAFDDPPERLLRFTKMVTDAGPFDAMALDILETEKGDFLVIELHAYFGCNSPHVMIVGEEPGRYVYQPHADKWIFEAGDFNRNASCNLRILSLLETFQNHGSSENLKE